MKPTLGAIAALALGCLAARGQDLPPDETFELDKPAASRRVAQRFDFDTVPGASIDLPEFWIRAQHDPPNRVRPGFPIWNRGELDPDVAFSGTGSVRLDTEGGSASLLLDPGVLQIFPDADYALVARVRTHDVDHARARLAAWYVDANGTPIPGSSVTSEPVQTGGEWLPITVRMRGDYPNAISIQIELLLEQPAGDPNHPFSSLEITRQDFTGAAWFDELAAIQIPRVEAWVDRPGNLIPGTDRPGVNIFVRDLVGEPLDLVYTLTDSSGNTVAEKTSEFNGGRLETAWSPDLDSFGWYRAEVSIERQGVTIGSAHTAFVWKEMAEPDERQNARGANPFSISVPDVPVSGLEELSDLVLDAHIPRVVTGLFHNGVKPEHERIVALGEMASRLAREGAEVGLAVGTLPRDVSEIPGPTPVLQALGDPEADGAAWLDPILVDLGHRIRWWRVGDFGITLDSIAMREAVPAIRRLRNLVPGAMLELPWSSYDAVHPTAVRSGLAVAQEISPTIPPFEIPSLLSGYAAIAESGAVSGWDTPEHTAVFRAPPEPSHLEIVESVLGAVHAWAGFNRYGAGAPRGRTIRMDGGWQWEEGRRPQLVPTPVAAAWLNLLDTLRGRKGERLAAVAPGVNGILLTPTRPRAENTPPIAVFWPEPGPDQRETLTLLLGPGDVSVRDLAGNRRTVEPRTLPNTTVRAHDIDLSDGIAFVEGVDPNLLRFLASVRLDPPRVQSNTDPQTASLLLENPWPSSVQGEFYIVEPGGLSTGGRATQDRRWQLTPRFGPFAVTPGETASLPISFDVSPAIAAGRTELVVDLDLSAPSIDDFVRVERTLDVGLEHISMRLLASYQPDPYGPDVMVYAIVENSGTDGQNVMLSVSAPGFPRQRAAPSLALPGQRLIKVFPFPGGRELLAGEQVAVGLTIRDEGARLRRAITIDGGE